MPVPSKLRCYCPEQRAQAEQKCGSGGVYDSSWNEQGGTEVGTVRGRDQTRKPQRELVVKSDYPLDDATGRQVEPAYCAR
jgi:hypothetical protein